MIRSLCATDGGPPRSVCGLANGLAALGNRVTILTTGKPGESAQITPDAEVKIVWLSGQHSWAGSFLDEGLFLPRRLYSAIQKLKPDLVHDNGIWSGFNHTVATTCARLRIPRVVSTRGMLTGWSIRQKRWKKRLAWMAYQRHDLNRAALIHVTAESEAKDLRSFGLRPAVAVISNGTDEAPENIGEARFPGPYALFLSRIHPKKGLLDLVQAWRMVRPAGWRLVIAGPDEGGHQSQVEEAATRCGIRLQRLTGTESGRSRMTVGPEAEIVFTGAVEGQVKWSLIHGAWAFVLPTYSENFGIAVAEALSCGVPVITTKGTPWSELETHHCGWWIDIGVEPLAAALRDAIAMPDPARREMGARGRNLVKEKYSWPKIAAEMKSVYDWVLGLGTKPACVAVP